MIKISHKEECTGCGACVSSCPQNCISMNADGEGFKYPIINEELCCGCNLCEKVCPYLHRQEEVQPLKTYAAYHQQEAYVKKSTSGGVFSILAEKIIEQGGVVFGARFDKDWQVYIDAAKTKKELAAFRGSKYVQARVGDSFQRAADSLKAGKKVLFSGTPCQIAGLKGFLRKDYKNLLTVEVACDGVPSPKVWNRYLREKTNGQTDKITDIKFRYKPEGWKGYRLMVEVEGKQLSVPRSDDPYIQGFIQGLTTRPSCADCKFRNGKSQADLTIADYWGVEQLQPEMDNHYGISLVIVRSPKGALYFPSDKAIWKEADLEKAAFYNDGLRTHHHAHSNRERFFKQLDTEKHFTRFVKKQLAPTCSQRIKSIPSVLKNDTARIFHKIDDKIQQSISRQAIAPSQKPKAKADKQKIGIYTLPLNYNYGGLLQAYALQTVLERMGEEVLFIDRPLHVKEACWKRPREKAKRIIKKYTYGNKHIRVFQENYEAKVYPIISQNTQRFIHQYLHTIQVKEPYTIDGGEFKAVIVGSDQIWRRAFHDSRKKCYNSFLAFAEKWDIKRIAYAASFGTNRWEYNPLDTKCCTELVQLFDAISVRELSGVKLCKEHLHVSAQHVLDPTMLLDANDYRKIFQQANTPRSKGNLLCYILDENSQKQKLVKQIEQKTGLTTFRVNSKADDTWANVEERIQPSVEQWLRGFEDAEFVITDSFHACVFSILFQKPFLVIGNKNRGMERFHSLLEMTGLKDRLITSETTLQKLPQSDIQAAQNILLQRRKESIAYLRNNIL